MTDEIALGEVAQRIAKRIRLLDGVPQIPAGDLLISQAEMRQIEGPDRRQVGVELIALATRFRETGGPIASLATEQLCLLAAELGGAPTGIRADALDRDETAGRPDPRVDTGVSPPPATGVAGLAKPKV